MFTVILVLYANGMFFFSLNGRFSRLIYLCFIGKPGMKLDYYSFLIGFTMYMLENIVELLPVSTCLSRVSL